MQVSFSNVYLRNVYFSQTKPLKKDNLSKTKSRDNLSLLPSYKISRAYAVINFGQNIPTTVEEYEKTSPAQIKHFRSLIRPTLHRNNIYSSDRGLARIKYVADEILRRFQDQRFVSLGRSPIPFLEMAKAMENGISDYDFVAFSKGKDLFSINTNTWQKSKENPTIQQLSSYRNYLKTIKMDPESIINKAKEGEKTVIIDYCESGGGMKAFLEILRDWSLEQNNYEKLKKSVTVAPMFYSRYSSEKTFLQQEKEYIIDGKKITANLFKEFNAKPIDLSILDYYQYLMDIFNHKENTSFEKSYPASDWEKCIPKRGPIMGTINSDLAKFAIIDFLARIKTESPGIKTVIKKLLSR